MIGIYFVKITQKKKQMHRICFFFCYGVLCPSTTSCMSRPPPPAADRRANNLQPERKGLSILFAQVDSTKQGADRAEQAQARGYDYATDAEGREVKRF